MVDWDKLQENIRKLVRGKQGLPLDDDLFQGLIRTGDDRERTKLSRRNVYRHAYMDLLAGVGGEEWEFFSKWAMEERALFIAEEGERAAAFINAIARKQQEQVSVPVTNITMQGQPQPQKEEKKGWFRR